MTYTLESLSQKRLQLEHWISATDLSASERSPDNDLYQGLMAQPKTIPARYFYDERGSQLFEQICDLPEYYLTRTETDIFQRYAQDIAALTGPCQILELGSGSSTKTRILLDAYSQQPGQLHYCPIDVSPSILELSARELLRDYADIQIHGLVSTYDMALTKLADIPQLDAQANRMICFIGSSLGNFEAADCDRFLDRVAQALPIGGYFLLGIDLRKDKAILEAAYDDAQGVTAAFNLNMLQHLNQRFGANFDLSRFHHKAVYNQTLHQIEMHLVSQIAQSVDIPAIDLRIEFNQGESILSEISRKFDLVEMSALLAQKRLSVQKTWTDPQGRFGVILAQRSA
jgi:L-histidine Nalpha-methyltransferase